MDAFYVIFTFVLFGTAGTEAKIYALGKFSGQLTRDCVADLGRVWATWNLPDNAVYRTHEEIFAAEYGNLLKYFLEVTK